MLIRARGSGIQRSMAFRHTISQRGARLSPARSSELRLNDRSPHGWCIRCARLGAVPENPNDATARTLRATPHRTRRQRSLAGRPLTPGDVGITRLLRDTRRGLARRESVRRLAGTPLPRERRRRPRLRRLPHPGRPCRRHQDGHVPVVRLPKRARPARRAAHDPPRRARRGGDRPWADRRRGRSPAARGRGVAERGRARTRRVRRRRDDVTARRPHRRSGRDPRGVQAGGCRPAGGQGPRRTGSQRGRAGGTGCRRR